MKKYIFTEEQIKTVVNHTLNEQMGQILKLHDLAHMASRAGDDYETLVRVFQNAYKEGGDELVVKLFKSGVKLDIEALGHGRYYFL